MGQLVENAQIGSIGATSIVSVFHYGNNDKWGTDYSRNKGSGGWRPGNATGIADDWRPYQTHAESTGTITIDTVSDITLGAEDIYQLDYDLHPIWLIEQATNVLRDGYRQHEDWLSLVLNPSFQLAAITDWIESDADGGAATTASRITTADSYNVFPPFISSGRLLNAAANGYIRQRIVVTRGEEVAVWWLVRADVGTAELGLFDVTNSVDLGTQVTTTEEAWQVLHRRESVTTGAAGTETLEVRLRGDGASDDLYMNGLILYRTKDNWIALPPAWEHASNIESLSYVTFGSNTASDVETAQSIQRTLIDPGAYEIIDNKAGANPLVLEWNQKHPFYSQRWAHPILINGQRHHIDTDGPFTRLMTEPTAMDRDLFCALWARRCFGSFSAKGEYIPGDMRINRALSRYADAPDPVALARKAMLEIREFSNQTPVSLPPRQKNVMRTLSS